MPAGLLGIEELDRAEIEAILARAKDFQPHPEPVAQETRHAARQDDRQPVLRSLHAHPHQLRNRRQAAGRRRGFDHRLRLQRLQGRIAGGYAEYAGRHAAGRDRDAPRGLRRAAFSGAPPADARSSTPATARTSIPPRRCSTRAPFSTGGRRSKACGWPSSATSRTAAWRARTCTCCPNSAREIVLCGPASLLPRRAGATRARRDA